MKVAVCSTGNTLDSPTDPRFGRCANFVVVDSETFEALSAANPGINCAQGAGIQAAQVVCSLGVAAVIAGNLGPNAHQVLAAAGIKVYDCAGETVRNAVNLFNSGSLQEISAPTVDLHAGMDTPPSQGSGQGQGLGQGRGMGMGGGMGRGGGGGRGRGRR